MHNEQSTSTISNSPAELRPLFMLDPDLAFLNHGSFGATPRPVFDAYFDWIRRFESSPVLYHGRKFADVMRDARVSLARFVNAAPDDVVFVTNATVGVNIVARSLRLGPDDEIVTADHEYGACDRTWEFLRRKHGFTVTRADLPLPVSDPDDIVERVTAKFSDRTRVLFLSHITSPTALTLPVEEICRRARERGIISVIDGAHAIGQIPLDMERVGADFYTSNLHKWLCAPKGSAFLFARKDVQHLLDPLVVSWGWEPRTDVDSAFISHHEYRGTREVAGPLATEACVRFREENDWDSVVRRCHDMVTDARTVLQERFGFEPTSTGSDSWYGQMSAFVLPESVDGAETQRRLFDEHRVEIPVMGWGNRELIRISVQGYNDQSDIDRLVSGLDSIL